MIICINAICPLSDSCARHRKRQSITEDGYFKSDEEKKNKAVFDHYTFVYISDKIACEDHLQFHPKTAKNDIVTE